MSRDSRQRCPETRHCQPDRCDVAGHGPHLFRDIILVCGVVGDLPGSSGLVVAGRVEDQLAQCLAGRRHVARLDSPGEERRCRRGFQRTRVRCRPALRPLVVDLTAARHGSPMASVTCPRRRPPSSLDVEDGKRWLGGGLRCRRSPPRSRAPDFTPRPGSQSEVAFRQAALRGSATSRAGRLRRGAQVASSANWAGTSSMCRGAPWRRERRSSG